MVNVNDGVEMTRVYNDECIAYPSELHEILYRIAT